MENLRIDYGGRGGGGGGGGGGEGEGNILCTLQYNAVSFILVKDSTNLNDFITCKFCHSL